MSELSPNRAHLIDVSSIFFRFYFAPGPSYETLDGWEVSALLASVRWLCQADFFAADTLVVTAFDESLGSGFRHELDEDYKANRPLPADDILFQLTALKTFCQYMGFVVLASEDLEADDLIACALDKLPDAKVTIHTRDKDLRQLLSASCDILDVMSKQRWSLTRFNHETGMEPKQVPLFLALMGDSSDNIIGVPGVGQKTAQTLLQHYANLDELLTAIDAQQTLPVRGAARIAHNIRQYRDLVEHNLLLTELRLEDVSLERQVFNQESHDMLLALAEQFNILKKLDKPLGNLQGYIR